jgi:molybdopterin-containing oxidoreductase family iron-sulfur binding subunit
LKKGGTESPPSAFFKGGPQGDSLAVGRRFWRSLDELADTEEFRRFLLAEFPQQASVLDSVDRRQFMKLMAASFALAGMSACTRQPTELIVPYVRNPEDLVPGQPLFYATAMTLGDSGAVGLLVESHMGRPTKVEGNPDHPASLGATDAFAQASVLDLYDPDRSQVITYLGEIRPWDAFQKAMRGVIDAQREKKGAGLRILTDTVVAPTLGAQLKGVLDELPEAKWHQWEPAGRDSARAGAMLAFGEIVETRYDLDKADVVLSLDADFLACGPGHLTYARAFARRRRVGDGAKMNRLYAVDASSSVTAANADHRLPLRPSQVRDFARAVAAGLGTDTEIPAGLEQYSVWIEAVVADLKAHEGSSAVIAGDYQPPAVHALAHAMNHRLGNVDRTVTYTRSIESAPVVHAESIRELAAAMEDGSVDVLLILGGNPVYDAPTDLRFAERMQNVALRVHLASHNDETSELSHWHVPQAHYLETWGDTVAFDGTATITQPLIEPLYGGKSAIELLSALLEDTPRNGYEIVRAHWHEWYEKAGRRAADTFDAFWRKIVHDGVVPGTALPAKQAVLQRHWGTELAKAPPAGAPESGTLEIAFRPDPTIYDGRFANNGWLQELSKPMSKLTWDNAALLSVATASRLGVTNGELLALTFGGSSIEAPAWILPGHPDDTITAHLGYGRRRAGRVGNGTGFNAYALRRLDSLHFGRGVQVRKPGARYALASTQDHHSMEGRDLVHATTLEEYEHGSASEHAARHSPEGLSLYPDHPYDGYAWGMAIDLSSCIGCNACTIACQAENNIAVVGKEQVARGREMQWIRVDRYFEGEPANPQTYHQPVPCMHCENAPCEVVCPVNATVHSSEGLNEMVYNRCVGTRYCSNNCPYKVRRFNFLLFSDWETETLKMQRNPDVTVRSRGVMEKCTYCVQRINQSRIQAKKEGRQIRDGEIVTACQQVCPTEAIVFGDINDKDSRVAKLRGDRRHYGLLEELGTRPRTTYLGAVRNPNPVLARKMAT